MATLLITSNPSSQTVYELGTGTFTIAGSANQTGTVFYYQWQKTNNVLGTGFVNVGTQVTSNTLRLAASAVGTTYVRCQLSASNSTALFSTSAALVAIADSKKQFAANGEAGTPRFQRLWNLGYVG